EHGIAAFGRKLAGVTVRQSNYVARKLDDRCLHAETDSKKRQTRLAREADGFQHSLDSAHSKPPGNKHAVEIGEQLAGPFAAGKQVAGEPGDFDADVICYPAMDERFLHALVAIDESGVFADDRNPDAAVRMKDALYHGAPA